MYIWKRRHNFEKKKVRQKEKIAFFRNFFKFTIVIDLPKGLFASGLLTKTLYAFLDCSIHATCPAQLGSLDLRFLIILGEGPGSSSDKALDYELDGPGSIPGV